MTPDVLDWKIGRRGTCVNVGDCVSDGINFLRKHRFESCRRRFVFFFGFLVESILLFKLPPTNNNILYRENEEKSPSFVCYFSTFVHVISSLSVWRCVCVGEVSCCYCMFSLIFLSSNSSSSFSFYANGYFSHKHTHVSIYLSLLSARH